MVESGEKEPTTEKAKTEQSTTTIATTNTTANTDASAAAAAADPSAARKRRKAIIVSQRKETEEAAQQKETENEGAKTNTAKSAAASSSADEGYSRESDNDESVTADGKKRKSKRTQIRYDPDVPMSKEQLAAWRREARRVRNRESAAASRQRIRNRITELETEVDEYKSKYHAALDRLKELERLGESKQQQNASAGESGAAEGKSEA